MSSFDGDVTHEGLPSPAYWRKRAERARLHADQMRVGDFRQTLLGIAKIYDSMADRAAEREARKSLPARRPRSQGPHSDDSREQA
jgi:hypothetical protein